MNRVQSKGELLKMYQSEASDLRDKKKIEREVRINEERAMIDKINRELDDEKRNLQYKKLQRNNERLEEYNQMNVRKQKDMEIKGKKSKYEDDYGTFKIGSDKREIKKKSYDDNNLILNPTRETVRQPTESASKQRGKSIQPNYNIINHTISKPNEDYNYQTEMKRINDNYNPNYRQDSLNNYESERMNQINNYDNYENYENLENYNKHYDQPVESKKEYDEAEYQKYYQEYLNSLRQQNEVKELNLKYDDNINELSNDINKMNIGNTDYRNGNIVDNSSYKENLNVNTQNEYVQNRLNNQKSYNDNNQFLDKIDNQKNYKSYLDAQVRDKKNNDINPYPSGQRFIQKKDRSIANNPYSTKNYDFGGSNLSTNPITNPVNSYQFNYNRYMSNNPVIVNRDVNSRGERMRVAGNNIIK